MERNSPLVTIAIPTYNRAHLLARSILSAQQQTHKNIEIIISDNNSSDDTESVCRNLAANDNRIHYFRQSRNIGGTENFNWLLSRGNGAYFMWLGDDDWIDINYVESCLSTLNGDPSLAFASGQPIYYKGSTQQFIGRIFNVADTKTEHRISNYLFRVMDNGVFYGVYRRRSIQELRLPDKFAGDWFFLCDVLTFGGFRMIEDARVHRELGGATESYEKLVKLYGLPGLARFIPSLYAAQSFRQHMIESKRIRSINLGFFWSAWLLAIILARPLTNIPYRVKRKLELL